MADPNMSQEEIDALLNTVDAVESTGTDQELQQFTQSAAAGVELSPLEREKIADEILQGLIKGTAGLSAVLNLNVNLTNPYAELRNQNDIYKDLKGNNVIFEIKVSGAINGDLFFLLPITDGQKIINIIMGGTGEETSQDPLDAAQIATIKDALNPLVFSLVSHLSAQMGEPVTPIGLNVINGTEFVQTLTEEYHVRIQYNLEITGVIDTKSIVIIPYSITKSILNNLQKRTSGLPSGVNQTESEEQEPSIPIKDVEFPQISTTAQGLASPNVNLLLDVQMTVTVELGRTKKYIKEILEMGEGTIIELDKQAGEHVDVLVNGKLIARGEVVVIDENFGVRVTEIISPKDRLGIKKSNP